MGRLAVESTSPPSVRELSSFLPIVYAELRRLANGLIRGERNDHTLQATALVHEAFLKLLGQKKVHWQNREHVLGLGVQAMRRVLIDHARAHRASKRGGGEKPATLTLMDLAEEAQDIDLLHLDECLERLSQIDPLQGRIVELRFFGAFTIEESAQVLKISPKKVRREWEIAKAWLLREMRRGSQS